MAAPLDADGVVYKGPYVRNVEQRLQHTLETEYGFPPATCRSLVHLLWEAAEDVFGDKLQEGQLSFVAVSAAEKPGKKLSELKTQRVHLTLHQKADVEILTREGLQALRRKRLVRLAQEAHDQGGLLTQEDLALLVCVTTRTIKRDIQALKAQGVIVPTRGTLQDIGPGVSHKARIVDLWLQGREYTDLQWMTGHATTSIQRYLKGFTKVVRFQDRGYATQEIAGLVELSPRVVGEYEALYAKHRKNPAAKDRLAQVLRDATPTGEKTRLQEKTGGGRGPVRRRP